jgi:hypothetical protein
VCRSSPLPQARPLRAQPPRVDRYFRTRVNMGLPPPTADAARAGLRRVWRNAEARRRSGTFAGSRHSDGWRAKNSRSPARDPKAIATPPSTTTSGTRSPLCQRQPTWQSGTRTLSPRNAETPSVKGQGQRHRAQHIVAKRETLSNSGARRSESLSRFRQSTTAADVWGALTRFRLGGADSDPWSRARRPRAVETYDFHLGSSCAACPGTVANGGGG